MEPDTWGNAVHFGGALVLWTLFLVAAWSIWNDK